MMLKHNALAYWPPSPLRELQQQKEKDSSSELRDSDSLSMSDDTGVASESSGVDSVEAPRVGVEAENTSSEVRDPASLSLSDTTEVS
jgi:hypothetical protein